MPPRRRLHDILVEHAIFPFPVMDVDRSVNTTGISPFDMGLLEPGWRAERAMRDDSMVENLCESLKNALGDVSLTANAKRSLQSLFAPALEVSACGRRRSTWRSNNSEGSAVLFVARFFEAVEDCLQLCRQYKLFAEPEFKVDNAGPHVDFAIVVNGNATIFVETESPSVMVNLAESLPAHGIKLTWPPVDQSLVSNILAKAALCLGLQKLEWLFLTCHNFWIACRLVRHDGCIYLTFSPMISIENSTVPFQMVLGAILAVVDNTVIESDVNDGSSPYDSSRKGQEMETQVTCSLPAHAGHGNIESELLVTTSSPEYPADSQIWVPLIHFPNDTRPFPLWDNNTDRHLWLTKYLGSGSTGTVWQCHFEGSNHMFAAKVTEFLHPSDEEKQKQLHREFNTYCILERAYCKGKLLGRIAPCCFGAFEGDIVNRVSMLILDLYDSTLSNWNELGDSDRDEIFKLVQELHALGISHGDIKPRHIAKVQGGGFHLIDFSEARKHKCKELHGAENQRCHELQLLRRSLWNTPIH